MNQFEFELCIEHLTKAVSWVGTAIIFAAIIRAAFNK